MPTQRKYAFFALLTVSICILALYIHRHRQGQTGKIDRLLISSLGGLQQNAFYLTSGFHSIVDHYVLLVDAKKKSESLEAEVGILKTRLTGLEEVEMENKRLRDALQFRHSQTQPTLAAHVVAHDVSSDYLSVRVDKGADSGVEIGMGVISPAGVIGRVFRVTAAYADVLTLVDPTSNIDVVIQRSRARGILSGQSKQLSCKMKYVDRLDDVQVNDTVVSTSFGNIFPGGLLVGWVTAVIPNSNGILQTVSVKSAVDIYRLEEVLIVFPPTEPKKTS